VSVTEAHVICVVNLDWFGCLHNFVLTCVKIAALRLATNQCSSSNKTVVFWQVVLALEAVQALEARLLLHQLLGP
jgi:uncharacterized membrane protein